MKRIDIVTNGCSGGCCTRFSMPVSMSDLRKMAREHIRARKEDRPIKKIKCYNGVERWPVRLEELKKLITMLIPIEETFNDPQDGRTYNEAYKEFIDKGLTKQVLEYNLNGHFKLKGGKLSTLVYTCKHFDKSNKVCTNYENRPDMCKDYGYKCKYSGCTYDALLNAETEKSMVASR